MSRRAILLSGGIDSAALAALLRPECAITIDYGQTCARSETAAAAVVADVLGVALLEKAAEDVELRRDHLRALRKGETISDEALSELERDAHRSYLTRIRAAGKTLRLIEREMEELLGLQDLLARCPRETDSKAEQLLNELRAIHREAADEKVIVFSEYAATIRWLADFLTRNGYVNRFAVFQGDLTSRERRQTLADFARPETLLLLSTDAASEGLNLQEHCHRVIHYELPFNPNRMLQRQGRVDRYGQTRPCRFAFLYAADTYEGEVLRRLFTRIENQVRALGSVGDVLGILQTERIEDMLSRSPSNLRAAIAEAERFIERELARANGQRNRELLGDDAPSEHELHQLQAALDAGRQMAVLITDFVVRAIGLAQGQCRREGDILVVPKVPLLWRGGRVPAGYDALYVGSDAAPSGTGPDAVLDDDHPLAQAAIRWVRESRYKPADDHRMAARLLETIDRPDLVATFLATVRAADGTEMERLLAVRVFPDGAVDPDDAGALLDGQGVGNVPAGCLPRLFGTWWESALNRAEATARERASLWQAQAQQRRAAEHGELKRRLEEWDRATRAAILVGQDDPGGYLPGMEKRLPPAVERRLREHRKEMDQQQTFLDRRLRFEPPAVELLGVLLRAPAREVT